MAESNSNLVCIAAEGFWVKNRFIFKEFCLLDCDSLYLYHTLIKSSKSFADYSQADQNDILYEEKNFGIEYSSDGVDENELIQHVFPLIKGKKVLVEHLVTVNWLKELFHSCGDIDCVAIGKWFQNEPCMDDKLTDVCDFHDSDNKLVPKCALFEVLGMRKALFSILPYLKDTENALIMCIEGYDLHDYGFICKEICMLDLNSTNMFHTSIKSPKGKEWDEVYEHSMCSIDSEIKFGNGPYSRRNVTS